MYLSRLLLAIWMFGAAGTAAELLLLEHFDGLSQQAPLFLFAAGLVTGAWYARWPGRASLRAFQATAAAFALSGVAGLWLHYRGNVDWELETYPGLRGLDLFWEAVRGATPTLAPGTMILLAAVGYAATVARSRPAA
jgi:hypothetical protein